MEAHKQEANVRKTFLTDSIDCEKNVKDKKEYHEYSFVVVLYLILLHKTAATDA